MTEPCQVSAGHLRDSPQRAAIGARANPSGPSGIAGCCATSRVAVHPETRQYRNSGALSSARNVPKSCALPIRACPDRRAKLGYESGPYDPTLAVGYHQVSPVMRSIAQRSQASRSALACSAPSSSAIHSANLG